MALQVWLNPNNARQKVWVLSSVAPASSPAPPGHPIVPTGYVRQMGTDGFMDTGGIYINGIAMPNISMAGIPYYTGVLSPVIGYDPAAGLPYHTRPNINRKDGIND